ncbi:MAG: hypothetical protein HQL01_07175 [Nitrospirae bacterium]|nr:hypothetical protein [Nitrospirota bacterium]
MPLKKVVVFSTDAMRGSLIQKALERWAGLPHVGTPNGGTSGEEIPIPLLFKDVIHTGDILGREAPLVVVLDTKGYFSGELEKFRNSFARVSAEMLPALKLLAIGDFTDKNLSALNKIVTDWCMDTPLDPMLIVSKVKVLLDTGDTGDAVNKGAVHDTPETDVLLEDLKVFLNIKI